MKYDEFWFWFGVWTSILALVIAGTITFTGLVPDEWSPRIVKICADLFAINNVILAAAKTRGYLKSRDGASACFGRIYGREGADCGFRFGNGPYRTGYRGAFAEGAAGGGIRRSLAEDHG